MKKLRSLIDRFRGPAHRRRFRRYSAVPLAASERLEHRRLLTIDIQLNYDYDSSGFFSAQERKDTLEQVASIFESAIGDELAAITPGGANNWTAIFNNPSTGAQVRLSNPQLAADQIVVYVGARNLSSALGLGGPGGSSVSGTNDFVSDVLTRGQAGVNPNGTDDTDVSLWGGTITFDSDASWHFSMDPPTSGRNDFFSVALHEMGHVLGIGTVDSFSRLVNGSNQFVGTTAVAAYGGPIPMHGDRSHFASGTVSTLPGTATVQESAFDPQITTGSRKLLTTLDWGTLADIGWEVNVASGPVDFGDAPDATAGTGPGNYQTRSLDDGPSHQVIAGLYIGDSIDGDDGSLQNVDATADDVAGADDEDFTDADFLTAIEGDAFSVAVNVTNTTSSTATLYGWVDYDGNGRFETGTESASVSVPVGTTNAQVSLTFPAPASGTAGTTFGRFRLSSDAAAAAPTGAASNGEVEDHRVTILSPEIAYDPLPLLAWTAVSGAEYYQLEVDNVSTGQAQVVQQDRLSEPQFRLQQALTPGNYAWRWRAFVDGAFQAWSSDIRFRRFATTGTPFITDPVGTGVDSLPTFAWSPVDGASRYELWVNGSGHDRIVHQTQLTNASFTPERGLPAGNYTAWVRAFDSTGSPTAWSSAFNFTVAESAVSVLTDPVGDSLNTTPVFAWLPVASGSYTLQIDDLSTADAVDYEFANLSDSSFTLPSGLPPGEYSATIQALGLTPSDARTFQVSSTSGQAEFTAPAGSSENPLPVFSWTAVEGATRYELWVDDVTTGTPRVIHESGLTGTAFAVTQPLSPATYRAWVRAFGASGAIGTWSSSIDYRITQADDVPTVWGPVGTGPNAAPLLAWSSVAGATHYSVDFGFGPTGGTGTLPLNQDNLTNNWLQIDTGFQPGDYQASVTAWNGLTELGRDSTRFVVQPASDITIYHPFSASANPRPTFTFSTVSGANRYVVWVNDLTRGTNALIYQSNLTSPVFVPDESLAPGDYRVWVRAYSGSSPVSSWSSGVTFNIAEVTAPPAIIGTLPNTQSSVPALTWTPVSGSDSYELQIDELGAGQNPLLEATGLTETTYRPSMALSPATYLVRVRSVTGGSPGAWSDELTLTVEPAASAAFSFPYAGASVAAADLFFAWSTVSDADRYELWVNNLTTGAVQVIYDANVADNFFTPATLLAAGDYRAWVRSLAADGSATAWTAARDFVVT